MTTPEATPSTTSEAVRAHVDTLVRQVRAAYPDSFGVVKQVRTDTLASGVTWPAWCWTPMAATVAYMTATGRPSADIAAVHAVTTWRLDRAVLVPDVAPAQAALDALVADGLAGPGIAPDAWRSVPTSLLAEAADRLPTWCPYIALPPEAGAPYRGAFVHLEADSNTGRRELRFVLDLDGTRLGLIPLIVYLDRPTLGRAVDDMVAVSAASARGARGADVTGLPSTNFTGPLMHGLLPLFLGAVDSTWAYADPTRPGVRLHRPDAETKPATTTTIWTQQPGKPRSV